jgi:heme-degrading monooxygenase HmoA
LPSENTTGINLSTDRLVDQSLVPGTRFADGEAEAPPLLWDELWQAEATVMFSVIFEVHPKREKFDLYLELAKGLRPILEGIDGFIDNERFESTRRPGWILSHSTWRDEKSVVRWRTAGKHHDIQQRGRDEVFQDYHLRVGEIVADTAPPAGATIVEQRLDETEIGRAKFMTLTEVPPESGTTAAALPDWLSLDRHRAD